MGVAKHRERTIERRPQIHRCRGFTARSHDEIPAPAEPEAGEPEGSGRGNREPEEKTRGDSIGRRRDRSEPELPVQPVRLLEEGDDARAHLREDLDRWPARVDAVGGLPVCPQIGDAGGMELEDVEPVARWYTWHAR